MKQFLLLIILSLAVCSQSFGQENVACPKIEISGPTGLTDIGGSMAFVISFAENFNSSNLEYKWTVSKGEITSGQGTIAIVVATIPEMQGQQVDANVEIKGLPAGCKNNFSALGEVAPRFIRCILYDNQEPFSGNSSWQEYLPRIQNLALGVQNEKGSKGVIIFKFTNPSEQKKAIVMKKKLLKMSKKHKTSLDGIEMKIQKGKVYETTFEFVPKPTN